MSKRNNAITLGSSVADMRVSSDSGIVASSTTGMKRPRRLAQNRLDANIVDHHRRHRTRVRRLMPSSADSFVTDFLDGPC